MRRNPVCGLNNVVERSRRDCQPAARLHFDRAVPQVMGRIRLHRSDFKSQPVAGPRLRCKRNCARGDRRRTDCLPNVSHVFSPACITIPLMLRLTLAFACMTYALYAADDPARTVWDGVYTPPQADRGQSSYAYSCRRCHGEDLSGSGNVLRGGKFMEHWREDTLKSLFNTL